MNLTAKLSVVLGICVLYALPAGAAVLFYNGGPNNASWRNSDTETGEAADDFLLSFDATVTGVRWFGSYLFGNSPQTDQFAIRFFNDSSNNPTISPFHTATLTSAVQRTYTGVTVNLGGSVKADMYEYQVDIAPLPIYGNTKYWLSIVNDTSDDPNDFWAWAYATVGSTHRWRDTPNGQWSAFGSRDLAFGLTGAQGILPEPAGVSLLVSGAVGILLRKRMRSA